MLISVLMFSIRLSLHKVYQYGHRRQSLFGCIIVPPVQYFIGGIGTLVFLKGQSQLLKGRPIYSNDCGKYSVCQLDHAQ